MRFDWLKPACIVVCAGLLGACAQTQYPSGTSQYRADPANAGRSCPAGKIQVCDKRKAVGCRCQSARHIRAFIGA